MCPCSEKNRRQHTTMPIPFQRRTYLMRLKGLLTYSVFFPCKTAFSPKSNAVLEGSSQSTAKASRRMQCDKFHKSLLVCNGCSKVFRVWLEWHQAIGTIALRIRRTRLHEVITSAECFAKHPRTHLPAIKTSWSCCKRMMIR